VGVDSAPLGDDDARILRLRNLRFAVLALAAALAGGAAPLLVVDSPGDGVANRAERPIALEARDDGFLARGAGYNTLLRPDSQLVALHAPFRLTRDRFGQTALPRTAPKQAGVTVRFAGAEPSARAVTDLPLAPVHYVRRGGGATVPTFGRVVFRNVYQGIDLSYHGRGGQLQGDWLVAPGADPRQIRLELGGAHRVRVDANGDVAFTADGLRGVLTRPYAFQPRAGDRDRVRASWTLSGRTLTFALGRYDRTRPLVIDPTLVGTKTAGGDDIDTLVDVDVDAAGNLVAVGATIESQFPRVGNGTFRPGGNLDGVVLTMSPDLQITQTVVLGGLRDDVFQRVEARDAGEWIVSGWTTSSDFPTAHALDSTYGGGVCGEEPCVDGLLLAFRDGALRFGTYLGGARDDQITSVALDRTARNGSGVLAFGGFSNSVEFVRAGGYDDLVGLVDYESLESIGAGTGYRLQQFGSLGNDSINGVAVRGNLVYAVGGTRSTSQLPPGPLAGFENAFILYSRDGGTTWQERVYPSPTPFSELDNVQIDADGSAYVSYTGFFPGGNYGTCSFGTCVPIGLAKLDATSFAPTAIAPLVPPGGHRYAVQDVDARRAGNGTIEALGLAVDAYGSFALSATPTGIVALARPDLAPPTTVELPEGTLAWGTAFAGESLFVAGVALEDAFDGVRGEADGFISKVGDLGLETCACASVATSTRAVRKTAKAVSFTLDWTMSCTGGSGSCEGELAVAAPRGVRISQPTQRVKCGPGECTAGPQRGSFRVTAAVTGKPKPRRVTFTVRKWCVNGDTRTELPAARVNVTVPAK
jgi:hypothetical protein